MCYAACLVGHRGSLYWISLSRALPTLGTYGCPSGQRLLLGGIVVQVSACLPACPPYHETQRRKIVFLSSSLSIAEENGTPHQQWWWWWWWWVKCSQQSQVSLSARPQSPRLPFAPPPRTVSGRSRLKKTRRSYGYKDAGISSAVRGGR